MPLKPTGFDLNQCPDPRSRLNYKNRECCDLGTWRPLLPSVSVMSLVLIECPKTHRHISTGVQISADDFDRLDEATQSSVRCPRCGKEHHWTKREAILVPPERWSDMREVQDCFMKAIQNQEMAAAAKADEERDFHLRMERKWLSLAEGYRLIAEVDPRHR